MQSTGNSSLAFSGSLQGSGTHDSVIGSGTHDSVFVEVSVTKVELHARLLFVYNHILESRHPIQRLHCEEPLPEDLLRSINRTTADKRRIQQEGLRFLRSLKRDTAHLHAEDARLSHPSIKQAVTRVNAHAFRKALEHIGYDDPGFADVFRSGAFVVGEVQGRPAWKSVFKPADLGVEEALELSMSNIHEFLAGMRESKFSNDLFKETEAEVNLGRMRGPFLSLDEVLRVLNVSSVIVSKRFAVVQIDKLRPCDDATRSFLNATMELSHKLRLTTIAMFLRAALLVRQNCPDSDIHGWKRDHGSAFRQIPVHPDHQRFLVVCFMHKGVCKYYIHHALPFGTVSSVYLYNRLSDALTALARRLLGIPLLAFFDDFFTAERADEAQDSFEAFKELNDVLGFDIKTKKDVPPTVHLEVLGHGTRLGTPPFKLSVTKSRKSGLRRVALRALRSKKISPKVSGSMAGKLNFAATALWGRIGRTAMQAFYARQHDPFPKQSLSVRLEQALRWVAYALPYANTRQVSDEPEYVRQFLFVDAEGSGGWGAVLIILPSIPEDRDTDRSPAAQHALVASCKWFHTKGKFSPPGPGQQIHVFETASALAGLESFRPHLLNGHISVFCDNTVQQSSLVKGFSKNVFCTFLAGEFWKRCVTIGVEPWIFRVPSAENIADEPSRWLISADLPLLHSMNSTYVDPVSRGVSRALLRARDSIRVRKPNK